jgi:lysyl-tRNA synthetase, class II
MADSSSSAAPPADQLQNLHLDEVTGERVSKSELKKRQKARAQEEKKKEKAAKAPPKPTPEKKLSAEDEESELSANVCSLALHSLLNLVSRGPLSLAEH